MKRALPLLLLRVLLSGAGIAPRAEGPSPARAVVERKSPFESPLGRAFHAGRRAALAKAVGEGGIVLQGAEDTRNYLEFRQSNDFWYLTGVETPGAALAIEAKEGHATLFLPPANPLREQWEGPDLSPGKEAAAVTGIADVREIGEFALFLEGWTEKGAIYTPFAPEEIHATSRDRAWGFERRREEDPLDGRGSREKAFRDALAKRLGPGAEVKNLSPLLDELRRVKTSEEIQAMREASRIGCEGHKAAIQACRPGLFEWEIAAVARAAFDRLGSSGPAYMAIVGTGPNSLALHYSRKQRRIADGDVVLMDFGPEVFYYATDITRTWPANGKFTKRQREVYDACLRAQEETLKAVKPGATLADLGRVAGKALADAGFGAYLRHGPSHYIGLAVHDVGSERKPFEPGVCVTVEPGIYIPAEDLGVRIEDTVVVTPEGCENLSTLCPRDADAIEALLAGRKPAAGGRRSGG
ncbi:MAG TPA: Xaa-Pro peptidase family protein [Planctomycetota bacterium]|jgi:Xaa-Pro aminopeptidase|nr:Xaa-Pro peptidase family protein [Planctomycetota bacterium]